MRLGDLDALKKEFARITYTRFTADMGQGGFEMFSEKEIEDIIDNAPTVDTSDDKYLEERDADAYETGYLQGHVDGYLKAEKDYAKPQGEWITTKVDTDLDDTVCSICGKSCEDIEGTPHKTNFCPNCGASMKGGTE